jgi:hypothetical protein
MTNVGSTSGNTPPILERLNIDAKNWLYNSQHLEQSLKGLAGKLETVKSALVEFGYHLS